LALGPRQTDDLLREKLADVVESFNATVDPAERVELHAEISRLRLLLGAKGRP
jgi:hypothetical protein